MRFKPFGREQMTNEWGTSRTIVSRNAAGVYLGIPPVLVPFLGIACGLVAIVRGARPLPEADGPASPGAQADAKVLCNTTLDSSPNRGIGITDVGGVAPEVGALWSLFGRSVRHRKSNSTSMASKEN